MRMPQATEQYVHVLRVSLVADSLNGRTDAARASPAPPNPRAPILDAASAAPLSFTKPRRLSSINPISPIRRVRWNFRHDEYPACHLVGAGRSSSIQLAGRTTWQGGH